MTKKKYAVLRRHLGDKMYEPGDEREVNEGDVAHLVAKGVLAEKKAKASKDKAEPKAKNKAEK